MFGVYNAFHKNVTGSQQALRSSWLMLPPLQLAFSVFVMHHGFADSQTSDFLPFTFPTFQIHRFKVAFMTLAA